MQEKRITIIVPEDMHHKFKGAANDRKTTMTDILIERIKEVLREEENKKQEQSGMSK